MKLNAQISEGVHRDNVRRWSVVVEDETDTEVCVLISESEITAESNAKQLFRLLSQLALPNVDLSVWPTTLQ